MSASANHRVVGTESDTSRPKANAPVSAQQGSIRSVVLFTVVVLSAGWLGRLLDEITGAGDDAGIGQLLWIIAPIGTAAVLRYRGGGGWGDAGLRPRFSGNGRWYALSLLFYPLVVGIAIAVGLSLDEFTTKGSGGGFPFGAFAGAFAIGLVPVMFTSAAEEFGWRGYLVPRLDAVGAGRWVNHLAVGLIWGAWHIPYVAVFWDYTEESMATLIPRILVGTVVAAAVYGEIRLATGSVWPAVVMHAMGNAFAGAFLADDVLNVADATPIVFSPGADGLIVIGLTAAGVAVAAAAARRSNPGGLPLARK